MAPKISRENGFIQVEIQGLANIQAFAQWQPVLEDWLVPALGMSQNRLLSAAQAEMEAGFQNPSGPLGGKLGGSFPRPMPIYSAHLPVISGALEFDAPYAWRRDRGFSGMTDSLGRTFTNDPGIFYMENALEKNAVWIGKTFNWAVNQALKELTMKQNFTPLSEATFASSILGVS